MLPADDALGLVLLNVQVRRVILKRRTSHLASDSSSGRWEVDPASDNVVLEENDDAFFADVGKTKDNAFVVINVHSKTTSEVSLLPAMESSFSDSRETLKMEQGGSVLQEPQRCEKSLPGNRSPTLLRRRRRGVEYYVDHYDNAFYVVTNSLKWRREENEVGEYQLVRVRQPGNDSVLVDEVPWEPVYGCSAHDMLEGSRRENRVRMDNFAAGSERASGLIQEMDLFKGKCLLYEACPLSGAPRLRIVPIDDPASPSIVVEPPSLGGGGVAMMRPGVNSWLEASTARFSLSSPLVPEDVFDLCLETGKLELLRRTEVPRFDGRGYRRVYLVVCYIYGM